MKWKCSKQLLISAILMIIVYQWIFLYMIGLNLSTSEQAISMGPEPRNNHRYTASIVHLKRMPPSKNPPRTVNRPTPKQPPPRVVAKVPPNVRDKTDHHRRIVERVLEHAHATDAADVTSLPTDETIQYLYGASALVHGLETCASFRAAVPVAHRVLAPAGLFNTGTNLISAMMTTNCGGGGGTAASSSVQVWDNLPWGKHTPASWREFWHSDLEGIQQKFEQNGGYGNEAVLPVVVVKDPYTWMRSMCANPYSMKWQRRGRHCPNLVDTEQREEPNHADPAVRPPPPEGIPVTIEFRPEVRKARTPRTPHDPTADTHHDHMAAVWNDFYEGYDRAGFPRLVVRYEDLLFRASDVLRPICECAGGTFTEDFRQPTDNVKLGLGNKFKNDLRAILKKYGNPQERIKGFTEIDLDFAKQHLDTTLMDKFGYKHPEY